MTEDTGSDELELLRRFLPETTPPVGAKERARARLRHEMERPARRRRLSPLLVAATLAIVLITGLVVFQALVLSPSPAAAALSELARVAEKQPLLALEPGRYAYSKSSLLVLAQVGGDELPEAEVEIVSFLLPSTREVWQAADGSHRIRTTVGQPIFFSVKTESAFEASDLAGRFGVGETRVESFEAPESDIDPEEWPTNAGELQRALRKAALREGTDPVEVGMLDLAATLLRETLASPQLRAAVLEVLSGLEGLELVSKPASDVARFQLTYSSDGLRYLRALTFQPQTTHLVEEITKSLDLSPAEGLPAGTVISRIRYEPTQLVTESGPE